MTCTKNASKGIVSIGFAICSFGHPSAQGVLAIPTTDTELILTGSLTDPAWKSAADSSKGRSGGSAMNCAVTLDHHLRDLTPKQSPLFQHAHPGPKGWLPAERIVNGECRVVILPRIRASGGTGGRFPATPTTVGAALHPGKSAVEKCSPRSTFRCYSWPDQWHHRQ